MHPEYHHLDPHRPASPAAEPRRRRKGPVMVTVVLLALGALGIATPALLPSADAAPMDDSPRATTVQTPPPLLSEDGPGANPSPSVALPPTPSEEPASPAPSSPAVESPAPDEADATPPPRTDGRSEADLAMEKRVLALVNKRRASAGCGAVKSNLRLYRASSRHSLDMAQKDYFSHTGADGSTPWDRAERTGYQRATAENLAAGQRTADEVVKAWMDSPAHRANLLDCDSRAIGLALARGGSYGIYWTQMFGAV
jgi:uncharacterized protein YkwD